jgi:hypothetical protein
MTWSETNTRLGALRDVIAAVNADPSHELPWNDRYAEIFGDPGGLVSALRYHWNLMAQAQLDPELSAEALDERWIALSTQQAGVLRVLSRHAAKTMTLEALAVAV